MLTAIASEHSRPVSFAVLRTMTVKINVTWDMTPWSLVSTLKIETTNLSEMKINIYQTTRHHIPEDSNMLLFLVGTVTESKIT
jgi:hypothetical protein